MIIRNSYDLAKYVSDLGMSDGFKTISKLINDDNIEFEEGIPFKHCNSFISGFGFTYSNKPIDWYYKGGYQSLTNNLVNIPNYVPWVGYETEIISIHIINGQGNPVYLGYTIAADYTYTGMRRENEHMKNISHLSPTIIANKVILDKLPKKTLVKTKFINDGNTLYKDSKYGGTNFMMNSPEELFNILFREKNLFSPYQIVYTLLGAITSSSHSGIKINCNSDIICSLPEKNININAHVIK